MSTRQRWQAAHLAWVLPLVIAGCAWGVVIGVAEYETSHSGIRTTTGSVIAIAGAVALVLAGASVLLGIRNAWRNSRTIRHRGRQKQGRQRYADDCVAGLRTAQALAAQILAGRPLAPLTVWGLVLRPGETAYFDLTGFHSRLVLAPHGKPVWSQSQPARVIATDRRMLCDTGTWRSVWYDDVTGFYPDIDNCAVVLDFENTGPVKLAGPLAPTVIVYLTAQLYGPESLRTHPQLQALCTHVLVVGIPAAAL